DSFGHLKRHRREFVALVVKNIERLRGLYDKPIQVREHLLNSLPALVRKEEDRNRFLPHLGIFLQGGSDCRTTVLPIVDDEVSILEFHFQETQLVSIYWRKFDGAFVRRCNGVEEIAVIV